MKAQNSFMEELTAAVTQSMLTRLLANIFAFLLLVSALAAFGVEILRNEPINQYILIVLGTGIGYSLHLLGLNQGVTLEAVPQFVPLKKDIPVDAPVSKGIEKV